VNGSNGWTAAWNTQASSPWVPATLEHSIAQNIRAAILTRLGERAFAPEFGSKVHEFLFRVLDSALVAELESHLSSVLSKCEPRISVREIEIGKKRMELSEIQLGVRYEVLETSHAGEVFLTVRP
jgi:uncharacterized protein